MSKWYEDTKNCDNIVLSSRIRLARNLKGYPFELKNQNEKAEVCEKVKFALSGINLGNNSLEYIYPDTLNEYQKAALVEKHLISPDFSVNCSGCMAAISKDEDISIMTGEEDHIRIQVIRNGLDLSGAYETANMLDDVLDESLDYAYSSKFGYLTACPTNLGTALRASVMMHLPALTKTNYIQSLLNTISKLGLTIRGLYGEGSSPKGAMYQISNQVTLGISEQEAINNLTQIVKQIINQEKQAREKIYKNKPEAEDKIMRSEGIMKYACSMSGDEAFTHISNLRLGVDLGIVKDIDISTLNYLLETCGSGCVCEQAGKMLSAYERDIKRAQLIKQALK